MTSSELPNRSRSVNKTETKKKRDGRNKRAVRESRHAQASSRPLYSLGEYYTRNILLLLCVSYRFTLF